MGNMPAGVKKSLNKINNFIPLILLMNLIKQLECHSIRRYSNPLAKGRISLSDGNRCNKNPVQLGGLCWSRKFIRNDIQIIV